MTRRKTESDDGPSSAIAFRASTRPDLASDESSSSSAGSSSSARQFAETATPMLNAPMRYRSFIAAHSRKLNRTAISAYSVTSPVTMMNRTSFGNSKASRVARPRPTGWAWHSALATCSPRLECHRDRNQQSELTTPANSVPPALHYASSHPSPTASSSISPICRNFSYRRSSKSSEDN